MINPIRKVQQIGTFLVIGCFLFSKSEEISFFSFYKLSFYIFIYCLTIITKATKKLSREWMNNLIDKLSCHSYITVSTERDIRTPLMVRCWDPTVIMRNSSYKERVWFVYSGEIVHINKESSQSLGFTAGTRHG